MVMGGKETKSILDRYSIVPSRSLGQNFVTDPNTIQKVVRIAEIKPTDQILEIGAGLGSLTSGLKNAKKIIAIEFDRYLIPALRETLEQVSILGKTEILHEDAMSIRWDDFFIDRPGECKMISNLPYNIASPLLLNILDDAPDVKKIIAMVQREVGERFVANVGTPSYGIPSVKAQYWAHIAIVGHIPPKVFFPVPKVDSVLLEFSRRKNVENDDLELMWQMVRIGFGQRRKMLRKSLKKFAGNQEFELAGLNPMLRPQDLTVQDWVMLANAVEGEL